MVVLVDGVEYQLAQPENEQALEDAVKANYRYVFGQDSLYFDLKRKMRSTAGVATIPDGYVILFDPKPRWCIVEVELSSHPLYDHIVAQLTKFNRGIENSGARRQIVDSLYEAIKSDIVLEAQMKSRIKSGEIYKFISDVVSEDPIIAIIIDAETGELGEALTDIRGDKRVVEFRTYRRAGISDCVHAYVFNPIVKIVCTPKETTRPTIPRDPRPRNGKTERPAGLSRGLILRNTYKGKEFTAEVIEGGQILFDGQIYKSPSAAAVAAIRTTGSPRETEDGWRWWKFLDQQSGEVKLIDELRREHS